MNKKEQDILQSLLKVYSDFYASKDLFNKSYFKYSPEEIQQVLSHLLNEQETNVPKTKTKRKSSVRDTVLSINSVDAVKTFYLKNLLYDRGDLQSKAVCLKSITVDELKHLYRALYSSPVRTKVTKSELLTFIENYLEGIDRALSMKP